MTWRLLAKVIFCVTLASLVSCGDQSLFLSMRRDTSDLRVATIADGKVLASGQPVPLTVSTHDTTKSRDLEMELTLTSAAGASVWHDRRALPALNEDLSIQLPDLPTGKYRLDVVVYSAGEAVEKKSSTFFVVHEGWSITGIKSFPPVITSSSQVLLKAELEVPEGADPYLRWSWKGKAFTKGLRSKGLGQTLWASPTDEGVYTINLEMFPAAPDAGADFPFTSSLAMTTDVYVSAGKRVGKGDLKPEESYLSLLHLQATLVDSGAGAKKPGRSEAIPVGAPEVVPIEDGFGYRLNGSSGFALSWLALPVEEGILKPFTVDVGLSFEDFRPENEVLAASASDGSFSLAISLDGSTHTPIASIFATGAPSSLTIPWTGPALQKDQRYLLSLSVVPRGKNLTLQWFLDGEQAADLTAEYPLPAVKGEGKVTIGGEKGFVGAIDEFGVFSRDAQGRPSPDPDQFARAMRLKLGDALVLADGFDGIFLPAGFDASGKAEMVSGSLSLAPGAGIAFPPMKVGAAPLVFRADLSAESAKSVLLRFQWEGSTEPALEIPVAADAGSLQFGIGADGQTVTIPPAESGKTYHLAKASEDGAGLVASITNPKDVKNAFVIEQVLISNVKD